MWWGGSERLTVYLGIQVAAVAPRDQSGVVSASWLKGESPGAAFDEALRSVGGDRARKRRSVLDVQLSGALARPFIFEAVDGLKSWKDANSVAATMAPDSTGLAGPCTVWLHDWAAGEACVAVAIETSLRDQIEEVAKRKAIKMVALHPWWKAAIDAATSMAEEPPQIVGAVDTDSLTVLTSNLSRFTAMATYSPQPVHAQARAVLTRAAMTANLKMRDVVWATLSGYDVWRGNGSNIEAPADFKPIMERCE